MYYILQHGYHKQVFQLNDLEKVLQNKFVTVKGLEKRKKQVVMLRTPKVIRQQAVKAVCAVLKAYKTNVRKRTHLRLKYPENIKLKQPIRFNPGFKSTQLSHDSICIEKVSFSCGDNDSTFHLYKNRSNMHVLKDKHLAQIRITTQKNQHKFRSRPKSKDYVFRNLKTAKAGTLKDVEVKKDFKIHLNHGQFYLFVPRTVMIEEKEHKRQKVVAIDPGVRKFATCYSPEGDVILYGSNTNQVLNKCQRRIDRSKRKLQRAKRVHVQCLERGRGQVIRLNKFKRLRQYVVTSWRKMKSKSRSALARAKKAYHRSEIKCKRVVKHFHYNVAHDLFQHFRTVILPTTTAHRWRQRKDLRPDIKRKIQMLRFGLFASRLKETASFYPGSVLLRGSEAYTSKQCGQCGIINDNLGASEVFTCGPCGLCCDRDVHAARNIVLRFVT